MGDLKIYNFPIGNEEPAKMVLLGGLCSILVAVLVFWK